MDTEKTPAIIEKQSKYRMLLQHSKRWRWHILGGVIGIFMLIGSVPLYAYATSRNDMYAVSTAPQRDVAIIFGAGLESPGKPSNFLESRLIAGLKLYEQDKAKVLVVSGDNRRHGYDEPSAMRSYLIDRGVPANNVVADYAGFNTYDTCYRANAIFGIKEAILVTHGYHLPRALMTCNARGVQSVGVRADRTQAGYSKNYWLREVLSLNKAALEISVHAKPDILGKQETSVQQALAQ